MNPKQGTYLPELLNYGATVEVKQATGGVLPAWPIDYLRATDTEVEYWWIGEETRPHRHELAEPPLEGEDGAVVFRTRGGHELHLEPIWDSRQSPDAGGLDGPAESWGGSPLREGGGLARYEVMREAVYDVDLRLLGLAHILSYGVFTALSAWMATFLWEQHGVGLEWAGPLAAALPASAVVARTVGGPLRRKRPLTTIQC